MTLDGKSYDVVSIPWTIASSGAVVSAKGVLYLIGGWGSFAGADLDFVSVWKLEDGQWTKLEAPLSFWVQSHNGYAPRAEMVYFVTRDGDLLKRFDLSSETEDAQFNASIPDIKFSCLVSHGSYLLFTGGYRYLQDAYVADMRIYDSDSSSWRDTSEFALLSVTRGKHACAENSDTIYVIGGQTDGDGAVLNTVEYIAANWTSPWTMLSDTLGTAMTNIQAVVYGDFILTFNGWTGSTNVDESNIIDTVRNTITSAHLGAAMRGSGTVLVGDNVYLFGGYVGGYNQDTNRDELRFVNLKLRMHMFSESGQG